MPHCFNPLPSQKQGETWEQTTCRIRWYCFNPLPSQKQGETENGSHWDGLALGFNPLPSQKQGETVGSSILAALTNVSIRSPHKSKGRLRHKDSPTGTDVFQSAPLTKARGDLA